MQEKTFTGYLVINYRDDEIRFRKTKPTDGQRAPTEVVTKVSVTVNVPELTIPEVEAEYDIPEAKVKAAVQDELLESDEPNTDYQDEIETLLDEHEYLLEQINQDNTTIEQVASMLAPHLTVQSEGYPSPEALEDDIIHAILDRI